MLKRVDVPLFINVVFVSLVAVTCLASSVERASALILVSCISFESVILICSRATFLKMCPFLSLISSNDL